MPRTQGVSDQTEDPWLCQELVFATYCRLLAVYNVEVRRGVSCMAEDGTYSQMDSLKGVFDPTIYEFCTLSLIPR